MQISLNLDHYCIETAVKRRHEQLIKTYFKTKGSKLLVLDKEIEALTYILEQGDFASMRSLLPVLSGTRQIRVVLFVPLKLDETKLFVQEKIYPLKWKI